MHGLPWSRRCARAYAVLSVLACTAMQQPSALAAQPLVGQTAAAPHDHTGLVWGLASLAYVLAVIGVWLVLALVRLRRSGRKLREANVLLSGILDNAGSAIGIKDLQGRYLLANEKLVAPLGKTPAEILGKTNYDFLPRDQAEALAEQDRQVAEQGRTLRFEYWIEGSRGRWCALAVKFPLRGPEGDIYAVGAIGTDITERKRIEETSRELQARFSQVLAALDQVVWLRTDEEMLFVNQAYEQMFGRSCQSLYENPLSFLDAVHPEDREGVLAALRSEDFRKGGHYDREYRILRPDGEVRWVRARSFPVFQGGQVLRRAGVAEDITSSKLIEENLRRSKELAEEAVRAKSRFLSSMSHEIRTPLNGVLGMLQVLELGNIDAEQREQINVAAAAAHGLLELVNDILDYSRIDSGQVELSFQDFRIQDVLRGVVETFREQAERKGLTLSISVDPGVPELVSSDPGRLRQILFNLVGNAIKFTEQGGVRVEVGFFQAGRSEGARNLLFSVIDTGGGIPEDKLDYIFEAFAQADESYTRKHRGAGLGLAIVRRLVELLGGVISVESEVGKGTAMHFSIDVKPASVE